MGVKRQLSDSCCVGNDDNVLTADDLWKKREEGLYARPELY